MLADLVSFYKYYKFIFLGFLFLHVVVPTLVFINEMLSHFCHVIIMLLKREKLLISANPLLKGLDE